MSSPYSGATPVSGSAGYPPEPPQADYAGTPGYDQAQGSSAYTDESYGHAGDLGTPTTEAGRPDVEGVSIGQLISEVTTDLSVLMRQELELAKAELKVEAKKAGQGAGMFGAAGLAGLMTVIFLSIALWWALSHLVGHSWSALIVVVLWAIVGAVTFSIGRKRFQQVNPKPERTVDTLQQVPGALKPN
ncbi:MAG TPA: phage holin family protein [Geodermatophilus sp.]|nr:phage holin family protein [Geodermatophilus sp.]